ncbi:MAG: SDR family NAD(P)-dependent oxidoreductase [Candidatus Caldarchaeum sp.]
MSKVVVTGGAGFIGSRVVRRFLEDGWSVTVVDDFSTGERKNLPKHPSLEVVVHDVTLREGLDGLFKNAEAVVHLAAVSSVQVCEENVVKAFDVNVKGVENVAKTCLEAGVEVIVFSSSAAVYGVDGKHSETSATKPASVYGHTKLLGETILRCLSEERGVKAAVLRIFNVYGRTWVGKGYLGVVDRFIDDIVSGRPLKIYGDGKQVRDFIHVDDVADAVYAAVEKTGRGYDVYNIGSGTGISVAELAQHILKSFGRDASNIVYHPARDVDIRYSVADITKAGEKLGFKPKRNLKTYIEERAKGAVNLGSIS